MNIFQGLSRQIARSNRNSRWHSWLRIVITFVLVVITCLGVLIVFSLNRLTLAQNNLNRVVINLTEQSLDELTLHDIEILDTALEDVITYINYSRLFTLPLRPVAQGYPDWHASLRRLDLAHHLAMASSEMLDGTQSALYFLIAEDEIRLSTGATSGARVMELLEFGLSNFESADEHLTEAQAVLDSMNYNRMSVEQILQYQDIVVIYEQLDTVNQALLRSPIFLRELLGIDNESNYLVLAQNNDEIRPSGGFIGSYGWMTISNGRVTNFNYSPSTENSPHPPPLSFVDSLDIPEWWINYREPIYTAWDGSWYVDFSDTAQLAIDYYDAGDNPSAPIDAVIAIDITGFEILLEVLGEVFIPEHNITVDAENFRTIVYEIRASGQSQADVIDEHKLFLADVYRAIQASWSTLPPAELPQLIEAMVSALSQKHVMLYYINPSAQAVVYTLGWGGNQSPEQGADYLLIADANLSGNKSNHSIQRSVSYDVNLLEDGSAEQRLAIQYDYLDRIAQDDPAVNPIFHGPLVYLNRLQIFTPANTDLTNHSFVFLESFPLEDNTQHVARIQVAYDSTERYLMNYRTANLVQTTGQISHYRLFIQKQAGAHPQTLDVRITLPEDAEFVFASPETEAIYESTQVSVEFLLEQTSDVWIEVIYRNP